MNELLKYYRKISIIAGSVLILIMFAVSLLFIKNHFDKNQAEILYYEDDSNLSYKVWLKENDYYANQYIEQENQYISNLIDNIETNFDYEFSLEENLKYNYDYEIYIVASVSDIKTGKNIYEFQEPLIERKNGTTSEKLSINEKIQIDYNKYNDLIKRFVTQYELKNVDSNLNVKMNVNINGETKKFEKQGITLMGLTIPLTTNTISIDTKYEGLNGEKIITVEDSKTTNKTCLYVGCIMLTIDFLLLIALIIYARKTETEEDRYKNEIRKIVNTYDSYISKIEDEFNMDGYQILKVASFVDLLEIRDTMHVPIIMLTNEENLTTCFMIPAANNILYFFSIGVTQYALPSGTNSNVGVNVEGSSNDTIKESTETEEKI